MSLLHDLGWLCFVEDPYTLLQLALALCERKWKNLGSFLKINTWKHWGADLENKDNVNWFLPQSSGSCTHHITPGSSTTQKTEDPFQLYLRAYSQYSQWPAEVSWWLSCHMLPHLWHQVSNFGRMVILRYKLFYIIYLKYTTVIVSYNPKCDHLQRRMRSGHKMS